MDSIKIFQIDDWAYVAASTKHEAEEFVTKEYERPEDIEDRECEEVIITDDLKKLLNEHIHANGSFPALIGVDPHYA